MLRYIYGCDLHRTPKLQSTMHRDRAQQFAQRLKWAVHVDSEGWERDEYDRPDTLYVIWEMPDGSHGGSLRLLPTQGAVMVNDHFADLLPDGPIQTPEIWECTRFCLRDGAPSFVAGALMLGGGEVMRAHRLTHLLGVFDARMVRIYRLLGSSPLVLGQSGKGRDQISVGLWSFCQADRYKVLRRASISSDVSEHWFLRAMGTRVQQTLVPLGATG